jgi:hypothetical protein
MALNRVAICAFIDGMNKPFSQVLVWMRNDHCFIGNRTFEYVVRAGGANKCPTLLLETADDIATVGQHLEPPVESYDGSQTLPT